MALDIISSVDEMQSAALSMRSAGKTLGFVPTMGALHEGHLSLIRLASERSDIVVSSIFVNPMQFDPNGDFEQYPRGLERDCRLAESAGTNIVFTPDKEQIYPAGFGSSVRTSGITDYFEGAVRPGYFDGIATVVLKLFNIVQPTLAIFGQKDYQQCLLAEQLVRDFNFPIEIVVGPTVREADGLAMSSRNAYLSATDRKSATILYKALESTDERIQSGERRREVLNGHLREILESADGAEIEFADAVDADTFEQPPAFECGARIVLLLSVRFGTTRLIDNKVIKVPE